MWALPCLHTVAQLIDCICTQSLYNRHVSIPVLPQTGKLLVYFETSLFAVQSIFLRRHIAHNNPCMLDSGARLCGAPVLPNMLNMPKSAFGRPMFVCLSVRLYISKTARPNFTKFFYTRYMWPWLDRGLTAMRYVTYFRFWWLTSCLHIIEQMVRVRDDACVSSSPPGGGTSRTSRR